MVRTLVSLILLGLLGWLVPHVCSQRDLRLAPARVERDGPARYAAFAEAQVRFGERALAAGDPEAAREFFQAAIARDAAHVAAWLRLAEADVARGDVDGARRTLRLAAGLTPGALRWKWPQALLARDLGLEDLFGDALNTLVAAGRQVNDALWLMDAFFGGRPRRVAERLWPQNREAYLRWLMRWRRPGDALATWEALDPARRQDTELRSEFVHFLMHNGHLLDARALWLASGGQVGITNPGFELPLSRRAFGWRFSERGDEWRVETVRDPVRSGRQALEVRFGGEANSDFHHVYQYVPVTPGRRYELAGWWKSRRLTSDQGPFLEVLGHECQGLRQKGPMLLGTQDWQRVAIEFEVPETCAVALVRLRRVPSRRFDNKLGGLLWMDDLNLREAGEK